MGYSCANVGVHMYSNIMLCIQVKYRTEYDIHHVSYVIYNRETGDCNMKSILQQIGMTTRVRHMVHRTYPNDIDHDAVKTT